MKQGLKRKLFSSMYLRFVLFGLAALLTLMMTLVIVITAEDLIYELSKLEVPVEEPVSSAAEAEQNLAPLTDDSTLNLLLLEQTKNKDYYKELFGLYKLASEGSLWSGQKEPFITIDFQFKQHSSESSLGTYIPKDKGGKIKWNQAAAGYPAHAFRSISINSYVIKSVNSSNLAKKLNQSPMGTMPTNGMIAGDGMNTVAYFQITADYFSGYTSANKQGTSPPADNKTLEPYGVSKPGQRLSDPYYLPDQLVWLANEYAKVAKKWISEDLFTKKGATPAIKSKIVSPLMTYNHTGEAWLTPRCYLGFGANIGIRKKSEFTLTGLSEEESYYKVGADMMDMANKMPKDFVIPALNSNQSKAMVALIPILFDDTYRINEDYYNWMLSHKKETLEMYKKLTQKPSATESDMLAFVKSKTEEPTEYAKMFGVGKVHGDPAVWCKLDGTITNKANGKSAKRIQFHTWIVWRAAFYGVGLTEQMYGKLLADEGVPNVDPLNPATYMNTLGQIQSAANATSPNTKVPTSSVAGKTVHNWVLYHNNRTPGRILEVGWKDGMPIFYQNLNKGPLAKWQIPKPQRKKSLTGPFTYYTASYDTLCWSGCGMNTMTSILHGVGLGNNPEIANIIDEGTGEKNLFSPVDLAHYFSYLQSSSFPNWYTSMGMSHSVATWMTYLGAPSVNFGTKDTTRLVSEMQKGYPLIVSSPNRCKYTFYEYTDDTRTKVTKRLSNYSLTTGGHIVAFYGIYPLKVDTGGTMLFTKLIDTSNHSKGVNNMLVPVKELTQISYSVLVKRPLVQNDSPPNTQPAPTQPTPNPPSVGFKPNNDKEYWANIGTSLLDMPYDLRIGTTNIRKIKVPASNDIRIASVPGDVVSYEKVQGNLFNVTVYRNDIGYIISNVRLASPPNNTQGKQALTNDIPLIFTNSTNVNISMFHVDSNLKFIKPYEEEVSTIV